MKQKRRTMYRVTNLKERLSLRVLATNRANAMARTRRITKWPNYGSDCEGYFGYSIDLA